MIVFFSAGKKKKPQKNKNAGSSSRSFTQSQSAASDAELVSQSTKLKTFPLDTGLLLKAYLFKAVNSLLFLIQFCLLYSHRVTKKLCIIFYKQMYKRFVSCDVTCNVHCVSKNVPLVICCNFIMPAPICIKFGK